MAKSISPSAMAALWARAEAQGTPWVTPICRQADFSAGCQSPYDREFESREDRLLWHMKRFPKARLWRFHGGASHLNCHFDDRMTLAPKVYFQATLPCRKCEVCLKHRAALWRQRACVELALSTRTWFGTFTVNPQNRFIIDVRARRNADDQSDVEYLARHAQISRELTLYFKRLRKSTHVKFRYLLVAEQHADGWPHYHALLHERGPMVTKRDLQSHWKLGFTNFKLVKLNDRRVSGYITKYIAKQALARIRASLLYGYGLNHNDLIFNLGRKDGTSPPVEAVVETQKSETPDPSESPRRGSEDCPF